VPNAQIDKRYFDWPYYIVPTDKVGQDAFAVIREAMGTPILRFGSGWWWMRREVGDSTGSEVSYDNGYREF